jgi:hypothetical protein
MLRPSIDHVAAREAALREGMRALADDLRLIDLADLVMLLRAGKFASVGSLVQASIELSFEPSVLAFGHCGEADISWERLPAVSFDLEFHHRDVQVYFRLIVEAQAAEVEIMTISFSGTQRPPEENTARLVAALAEARRSGERGPGEFSIDGCRTSPSPLQKVPKAG